MTVRQLLASVDSAELSEWMAFMQIEAEREAPPAADPEAAWRKVFGRPNGKSGQPGRQSGG